MQLCTTLLIVFNLLLAKGKMLQCNITSTSQETSPRWSLVTGLTFSRDSHAAAVFKDKIWIVGGVSTSYYTQRLEQTTTRSDIVWTADGTVWTEVLEEAPFRRRFGHTLTTFKGEENEDERLTLIGGFSPEPATDIWTSSDGATWTETTAKVPWSGRGYHCTVVFDRKLWIMGGSPLNNDVWFTNSVINGNWTKQTAVSWSPRAAHGCAAHKVVTNVTIGDSSIRDYLFVIGGWDDTSINDVWRMDITGDWTQLLEHAPWKPRGWHSVISFDSRVHFDIKLGPRLWVIGGGIIGKGVEKMFPYSDVWYTRDGVTWEMASSDASGVSTAEWSIVSTRDKEVCTGKWGHAVVPFYRRVKSCYYCGESCVTEPNTTRLANQIIPVCKPDTNQPDPPILRTVMRNSSMQTRTLYPDQCGLCLAGSNARFVASTTVPALYLIAGNVGTQKVKDVFVSGDAMLCERDGVLCSNNGTCTLGGTCLCISGKQGQFCELDLDYTVVDNKNCFPDVAMVLTPQGKRAMRDIVPGDSVFSFDTASGNLVFSPVYYIPHDASQHIQTVFVQVHHVPICSDTTRTTRLLEITPSHLLYVVAPAWKKDFTSSDGCNVTSNYKVYKYLHQKSAKDISVGDLLVVAYPVDTPRIELSRVVSLNRVRQPGAMTLYTMTGNFFVEGVLSSNFADLYPHLKFDNHRDLVPFALFQPHRLIYALFPYSSTSRWLRNLMDTLILPLLHNLF